MNAAAPTPSKAPSKAYLHFSRTTARALSVGALGSLCLSFALKFLLADEPGPQHAVLQLTVGVLGLAGMVASVLLFLSTYSFRANAPDAQIDEREVLERNRAYFRAYQTLVFVRLAAGHASGRSVATFATVLVARLEDVHVVHGPRLRLEERHDAMDLVFIDVATVEALRLEAAIAEQHVARAEQGFGTGAIQDRA